MKIKDILPLSLILLIACIASAQTAAPCGGAQRTLSINWYQGNFDPCLTDNNPYETKLRPSTVGNLVMDYFIAGNLRSAPAVVNGVIYSYDSEPNSGIVEARGVDGSFLWQHPVAPTNYEFYVASPAYASGIVYAGDGAGVLWALKASDGTSLWKYATNSQWTLAPTVSNGVVYVTESHSTPSYTYALNAATGLLLWKYQSGKTHGTQPAVNGNLVYAGGDNQVAALDASTGTPKWVSTQVGIPTAVAVYNGRVYVADQLSYIHALNAATGVVLWTTYTGLIPADIAVANNKVYAQDGEGGFWALDAYTGEFLWRIPSNFSSTAQGMAVANGVLYGNTFFNPTVGEFIALDAETGTMLWSYPTAVGGFVSGPTVVNGTLFAPRSGDLFVFHLPSQ